MHMHINRITHLYGVSYMYYHTFDDMLCFKKSITLLICYAFMVKGNGYYVDCTCI